VVKISFMKTNKQKVLVRWSYEAIFFQHKISKWSKGDMEKMIWSKERIR